ncbi:MAG: hypothetical protein M1561_07565 [Gammaproteobacteria bacterium]|nr:hypothetical protein [Gammaproteobacteria bacterium]
MHPQMVSGSGEERIESDSHQLIDYMNHLTDVSQELGECFIKDVHVRTVYLNQIRDNSRNLVERISRSEITAQAACEKAIRFRNQAVRQARCKISGIGTIIIQDRAFRELSLPSLQNKKARYYFQKSFAELSQSQKNRVYSAIVKSSGVERTRELGNINTRGIIGRCCQALSYGFAVYNVACAENKVRQIAIEFSRIIGGAAGGGFGAIVGSLVGPAGSVVGIVAGGAGGSYAAEKLTVYIIDKFTPPKGLYGPSSTFIDCAYADQPQSFWMFGNEDNYVNARDIILKDQGFSNLPHFVSNEVLRFGYSSDYLATPICQDFGWLYGQQSECSYLQSLQTPGSSLILKFDHSPSMLNHKFQLSENTNRDTRHQFTNVPLTLRPQPEPDKFGFDFYIKGGLGAGFAVGAKLLVRSIPISTFVAGAFGIVLSTLAEIIYYDRKDKKIKNIIEDFNTTVKGDADRRLQQISDNLTICGNASDPAERRRLAQYGLNDLLQFKNIKIPDYLNHVKGRHYKGLPDELREVMKGELVNDKVGLYESETLFRLWLASTEELEAGVPDPNPLNKNQQFQRKSIEIKTKYQQLVRELLAQDYDFALAQKIKEGQFVAARQVCNKFLKLQRSDRSLYYDLVLDYENHVNQNGNQNLFLDKADEVIRSSTNSAIIVSVQRMRYQFFAGLIHNIHTNLDPKDLVGKLKELRYASYVEKAAVFDAIKEKSCRDTTELARLHSSLEKIREEFNKYKNEVARQAQIEGNQEHNPLIQIEDSIRNVQTLQRNASDQDHDFALERIKARYREEKYYYGAVPNFVVEVACDIAGYYWKNSNSIRRTYYFSQLLTMLYHSYCVWPAYTNEVAQYQNTYRQNSGSVLQESKIADIACVATTAMRFVQTFDYQVNAGLKKTVINGLRTISDYAATPLEIILAAGGIVIQPARAITFIPCLIDYVRFLLTPTPGTELSKYSSARIVLYNLACCMLDGYAKSHPILQAGKQLSKYGSIHFEPISRFIYQLARVFHFQVGEGGWTLWALDRIWQVCAFFDFLSLIGSVWNCRNFSEYQKSTDSLLFYEAGCRSRENNEMDRALTEFTQARSCLSSEFLQERNLGLFCDTYYQEGVIKMTKGNFSEAVHSFREGKSFLHRYGNEQEHAEIFSMFDLQEASALLVKNKNGEDKKEIESALQCLSAAKRRLIHKKTALFCLDEVIGVIYLQKAQCSLALRDLPQAIKYFAKAKNKFNKNSLRNKSDDNHSRYLQALTCEYGYGNKFAEVNDTARNCCREKGATLFDAVAIYVDQNHAALRQMAFMPKAEVEAKAPLQSTQQDFEYAVTINLLATALKRSIVVIKIKEGGCFEPIIFKVGGDPIFVQYNENTDLFSGLLIKEPYFLLSRQEYLQAYYRRENEMIEQKLTEANRELTMLEESTPVLYDIMQELNRPENEARLNKMTLAEVNVELEKAENEYQKVSREFYCQMNNIPPRGCAHYLQRHGIFSHKGSERQLDCGAELNADSRRQVDCKA